jgi:hypothetical protein
MKTFFKLKIGVQSSKSGLLPLPAGGLLESLVVALKEYGGEPELWRRLNPHVEIHGKGSTLVALQGESELTATLLPAADRFLEDAERLTLRPKGRLFVEELFKPSSPWDYVELSSANDAATSVLFDHQYREKIEQIVPQIAKSIGSIYAVVRQVGGISPTVRLEIIGHAQRKMSFSVKDHTTAKKLASRLYEKVKLHGITHWDTRNFEIVDFEVHELDEAWQDVHLYDVVQRNGGVLPIELFEPRSADAKQ